MSSFVLKIIAVICMFCDHFGDAFVGHFSFLNIIGRIAFPIFAFQISEGYIHTKNIKKYLLRLVAFACISQIPFHLFLQKFAPNSSTNLNIFFTLILGLLCIMIYDYFSKKDFKKFPKKILGLNVFQLLAIFCVILIAILAQVLKTDYGFWGVIVIFAFYLFKNNKLAMIISFISIWVIRYGLWILFYGFNWYYVYLCLATISPILLISLYNGKQGIKIKYLLYIFYPLHLLLLYLFF